MVAETPGSQATPKTIIVLGVLWVGYVIWSVASIVLDVLTLLHTQGDFPALFGIGTLFFNVWGLAASLGFASVVIDLFGWLNGRRLIVGCMALAMMLGAMSGSLAHQALAAVVGLFTQSPIITGGALSATVFLSAVLGLFLTVPLMMLILGASVIATVFTCLGAIFALFVAIPSMLFRQVLEFDNAVTRYKYEARGLAGYIVRAVYWLRNEPLPDIPPDEAKGARFATTAEKVSRHTADIKKPGFMYFGHYWERLKLLPFTLHTEKHILIMASTRSGKGVSLIIPHLLRYEGSAFVLDPKGENARATARRRRALNNKVHVLDPFDLTGLPPARFNPLSRFTATNMEAESKALAAALFVVGPGERDHWTAAGQQLLASIILYVALSPDILDKKRDLPTVRKLLLGNLKPTLKAMAEMDEADGLLSNLALSFLETPEKEFGSIISTAQRQTEILDNPQIIACLSEDGPGEEVDFEDWRHETMTVYLCLSAPKFPTFNRWLRLVLTSALDEMTDRLAPPPLPVCFMLDELATLGHLQAVENAVGLAAGYGIQLVSVFQDVAQMRDLYKGRWASFIGNAGVRALFNLDDYDTAKYWSDFIGGTVVETSSRQETMSGLSSGRNIGETLRPLIPPDKMMMDFAAGKMLVLAQGLRPVITNRIAYFDDPGLKGLWDDPRKPVEVDTEVALDFFAPGPPKTGAKISSPTNVYGSILKASFEWPKDTQK